MLVYRLEGSDGFGPWWSRDTETGTDGEWIRDELWNEHQELRPVDEFDDIDDIETWKESVLFGCNSIDQLNMWFPRLDEYLEDGILRVVTYNIPDEEVFIGKNQVAFHKCYRNSHQHRRT
jgi:hypothetical protein